VAAFRPALLQLGHTRLHPLLCKSVEVLDYNPLVLSDLVLKFIALLTHRAHRKSGGSKCTLSHRWRPGQGDDKDQPTIICKVPNTIGLSAKGAPEYPGRAPPLVHFNKFSR
jgi:hypothetical protein